MQIEVLENAELVAQAAAQLIAQEVRMAVEVRGRCVLAVSGGRTPWQMLKELGKENLPWEAVHVFQVDERIAPDGDPDRNLGHLYESLLSHAPLARENIHAMQVGALDPQDAALKYERELQQLAGNPAILDLIHLGLGNDGHTASLVPGDPVLRVQDKDVAMSGVYQGRRRLTLTFPVINRARRLVWLVTGAEKSEMLDRLVRADASIPAGMVRQDEAVLLVDRVALTPR